MVTLKRNLFIYFSSTGSHHIQPQVEAQPTIVMGRRPGSHLDILRSNVTDRISNKQKRQKEGYDWGTVPRSYTVGEVVWVLDFAQGLTWLSGLVLQNQGQC